MVTDYCASLCKFNLWKTLGNHIKHVALYILVFELYFSLSYYFYFKK